MKHIHDELSMPDGEADYDTRLAAALRRLWSALTRGVQHAGPLEGLQRQQFWVLGALKQGPQRMSDLAEHAQTSQTSLTGIVDRLEERGLVQRTRSDADRRVVEVELTESGSEIMRAANLEYHARLEHLLEPLTGAERDELLRLVSKMTLHQTCRDA